MSPKRHKSLPAYVIFICIFFLRDIEIFGRQDEVEVVVQSVSAVDDTWLCFVVSNFVDGSELPFDQVVFFIVVLGDFFFIIEACKPSQDHDTKLLDEVTDRALMDCGDGDIFRGTLYDEATTRANHFSLKFRLVVVDEEGIFEK